MRNKVLLPILALSLALAAGSARAAEIRWLNNIDDATQIARQSNRLVLVHFWSTTCPPCVRLEQNVFSAPGVAASIEANFVPVKINIDNDRALARAYDVRRWPTDVVLTAEGEVLASQGCHQDPTEYLTALQMVTNQYRQQATNQIAGNLRQQIVPNDTRINNARYQDGQNNTVSRPPYVNGLNFVNAPGTPQRPSEAVTRSTPPATTSIAEQSPGSTPELGKERPRQQSLVGDRYASLQPETTLANQPVVDSSSAALEIGRRYSNQPMPSDRQVADVAAPQPEPSVPLSTSKSEVAATDIAPQQSLPAGSAISQLTPQFKASVAAVSPPVSQSNPPLAIEGRCPVTILEKQKWTQGDERYGAIHRGQTYLFAGPQEQQMFLANPDRYTPALGGNDPVIARNRSILAPGKIDYGLFHNGRIFLFANKQTLDEFYESSVDSLQRRTANAYEQHVEQAEAGRGTIRR